MAVSHREGPGRQLRGAEEPPGWQAVRGKLRKLRKRAVRE